MGRRNASEMPCIFLVVASRTSQINGNYYNNYCILIIIKYNYRKMQGIPLASSAHSTMYRRSKDKRVLNLNEPVTFGRCACMPPPGTRLRTPLSSETRFARRTIENTIMVSTRTAQTYNRPAH